MNIEELKQELLNASVEIDLQGYGQANVIFESDFNELVEKLANKLSIHDVVERSEQLVCEKCNGTGGYSYTDNIGFNYKTCECQTN